MLLLTGIEKCYGASFHLEANLEIVRGELLAILGPSGCGKTTVLRIIAGLEAPDSGTLSIAGEDVTSLGAGKRPVGMVFQDYALFPHLDVAGNVGYSLRMAGVSRSERSVRVGEALALVGLSGKDRRDVTTLSGGEKQRIALARCLVAKPQVLLLDEPFSALDEGIRKSLRREIRDLQRQLGLTTIFVTHSQDEALSLADRIAVMRDGKVLQVGTPREVYDRPISKFVAEFLGDSNCLTAAVVDSGDMGVRVRLSVGGELSVPCSDDSCFRHTAGMPVWLAIRPEDVHLAPLSLGIGDDDGHLRGEIEHIEFMGPLTYVAVATPAGRIMAALHGDVASVGTKVVVRLPGERCTILSR